MAKQSKQIIIDAIVKEIEKGNRRGNVLGKIAKKWEISRTTFDRYWKTANQQQQERQKKASAAADAAYIAAKEQSAKEAVMSKQERLELLSKIAKGDIEIPDSEIKWDIIQKKFVTIKFVKLASHAARVTAIAEMNKMEGDYAPVKIAQTNSKGDDLENKTDEEIKRLLEVTMSKLK